MYVRGTARTNLGGGINPVTIDDGASYKNGLPRTKGSSSSSSSSKNNTSTVPEPDYTYLDPAAAVGASLGQYLYTKIEGMDKDTKDFLIDKSINSAGWALSKWAFTDIVGVAINCFRDTPIKVENSWAGVIAVPILEMVWKSSLKQFSNNVLGEDPNKSTFSTGVAGFTKSFSSLVMKNEKVGVKAIAKGFKSFVDKHNPFSSVKSSGMVKVAEKAGKFAEIGFSETISKFALGTGIDYVSGLGANVAKALVDGKPVDLSTVKPGSTLLKSASKMICATGGEMIGSVFGPAGAKTGKIVGTAVGAFVGEVQAKSFETGDIKSDETWCAVAGAAEIGGAVAGAAVVVALASNPAGWAIGAAMIAGAAVGFGVTWLARKIFDNKDSNETGKT